MKFETHLSWALALTCMTEGLSLLLLLMTILLMLRLLPLSNSPSGYSESVFPCRWLCRKLRATPHFQALAACYVA